MIPSIHFLCAIYMDMLILSGAGPMGDNCFSFFLIYYIATKTFIMHYIHGNADNVWGGGSMDDIFFFL